MGKEEYTQKFLEEQLKLWKNKISKRKKWVENVKEYKNTIKNTQKYLNKLEESLKDISFGEQYQEMKNLSKQHSTNFLDYLNDENIKEFLNIDYFQKIENSYKEKYWGKQIIKKIKKDLITAIELFRLPHSASSRRGLHFEVCNNNFIEDIKDFFENAKNVNYYNTLNGTYPYRSKKQDTFNLYENENVALELFGWINLAKQKNNNFVAIYNNKVIDNLKILMGTDKKLDDLDDFYNVYTQYLKQLYDNNKDTYSKEELLYADQFFQYIHELNIKQSHKNIIYYGAPGTGKTYSVLETIKMLTDEEKQYYKMVQFHPSYSYEDFIEGIKPSGIDDNGNLRFGLVNGEFKKFCIKANQDREHNYYFIIDEINRAELSRVFGEILFCLEYRLKDNDKRGLIRTPYANLLDEKIQNAKDRNKEQLIQQNTVYWDKDEEKSYFGIPDNLYVIGTMNDIDKSIDSFDLALRRRFVWEYMECDYEVVEQWLFEHKIDNEVAKKYIIICKNLNNFIVNDLKLSKSYKIGHSYFMKLSLDKGNNIIQEQIDFVWNNHIKPLLFEYLRSEYSEDEIEKHIINAKNKFKL